MTDYVNTIDDLNDSKYKASTHQQLLLYLCIDGELEVVKWIYEEFVSNSASRLRRDEKFRKEPTIIFDSNVLLCSVLSGNAELVRFILCINPEIMEQTVVAYSSESNMNLISISLFSSIKNGFIDVCEYLMGLKKEFGLNNEESEIQINVLSAAFISALKHGFIDICELIISIKPDVDVTLFNYRCFYSCCNEGHLEAAKWFYDKYPGVLDSIGFEIAFSYSSCRKHSELTKWLFTVKPQLGMDII
jgi:hypothetical protein